MSRDIDHINYRYQPYFQTTMTSTETPIVAGQFDDPEGNQQIQNIDRGDHAYIDTHDFEEGGLDLEEEDEDEDEDYSDDEYDDNRVEDEDWENAERGVYRQ